MAISWIAFACLFGCALLGMLLRRILPERHLTADSKDVVKLGMGLIATMLALVLGLLIALAKGSYAAKRGHADVRRYRSNRSCSGSLWTPGEGSP
jgi:hypothetical protein